MPIGISSRGALALTLVLVPTVLTYANVFGWILLILFVVKYVCGESTAQVLYAWHNMAIDFCNRMFHVLCAAALELVLGTRIAYTVISGAGVPPMESRFFNNKLKLDMSRILAPPPRQERSRSSFAITFADWIGSISCATALERPK